MLKRRGIYLFIPLLIVVAYTFLYSLLNKPKEVEAQACLSIEIATCVGTTCTPVCPAGAMLSSDISNSGYTPGVYGVAIMAGLCFIP